MGGGGAETSVAQEAGLTFGSEVEAASHDGEIKQDACD
jgi:hypothetical protein